MNWKECQIIASELNTLLKNGRIQKIAEGENGEFIFSVYSNSNTFTLIINVNREFPRIHLTWYKTPKSPVRNFTQFLRKYIEGKKIENIDAVEGERIIKIILNDYILVFEIFSAGGNAYVLGKDKRVVYSLHEVDFDKYGFKPEDNPIDVKLPEIPSDTLYNELLDKKYKFEIDSKKFTGLYKKSLKLLNKEKKRIQKKLAAIERDKDNTDKYKEFEKKGNLLKTYLYDLKKGSKSYKCTDYETGDEVEVKLDPKLSPEENMSNYFKKAKKLRKGKDIIGENIKRVNRQLNTVLEYIDRIEGIDSLDELNVILDDMSKEKYLRKITGNIKTISKSTITEVKERKPYRTFINESGDRILVGKGNVENDKLTFTHSKGRDTWLHVADYPGSHVVVPVDSKNGKPGVKTLQDAALLAVHYSKAKGKDVDVNFTERKFVNKSKGMPKGMVTLSKFKTIFVKYCETRIRELFEMSN